MYFGTDSGTSTPGPCGSRFYIGRLGYGTHVSVDWHPPSDTTPACPYWNIVGPTNAPDPPTEWGQAQANAFWDYYVNNGLPSGSYI